MVEIKRVDDLNLVLVIIVVYNWPAVMEEWGWGTFQV